MKKSIWKPGNMLYPVPAVMVTTVDKDGRDNIITLAWAGTINSDPPMLSISVRKERFSHHMLMETGEFVVNLATEKLTKAMDFCGVRSGRDMDKFEETGLTRMKAEKVAAPLIGESPVCRECKVRQVIELGSHDVFLADIVAVQVDDQYLDEKGKFHLNDAKLVAYSHGTYFGLGKEIGTFGYSVRKKPVTKKVSGKKSSGHKAKKKDK